MQEQPKGLDRLAKRFRHDISLVKNGVSTCFGLDGRAAVAKYKASSAALINNLDREFELALKAGITLDQAYDLYEAEMKQNRCTGFYFAAELPLFLLRSACVVKNQLQRCYGCQAQCIFQNHTCNTPKETVRCQLHLTAWQGRVCVLVECWQYQVVDINNSTQKACMLLSSLVLSSAI